MIKYVEIKAEQITWREKSAAPGAAWDYPVWVTPVDATRRVKVMEPTGRMAEQPLAPTRELTLPLGVYSNDIEVVLQRAMEEAGLDPKRWDGVAVRAPNGLAGFYVIEPAPKSSELDEWTAKLCEGLGVPRSLLEQVDREALKGVGIDLKGSIDRLTTAESYAFDLNLAPRSIFIGSPGVHSAKMPGPGEVVLSPGPGQTLGQLLDEFLDKSSGPEAKYGVLTVAGLKVEPKS